MDEFMKYKETLLSKRAKERLSEDEKKRQAEERAALVKNGYEWQYKCVAEMSNMAHWLGYPVFFGGTLAGSRLAYDMGITDINPYKYDLSFLTVGGFYQDRAPWFDMYISGGACYCAMFDALTKYVGGEDNVIEVRNLRRPKECYLVVLPEDHDKEAAEKFKKEVANIFEYDVMSVIMDYVEKEKGAFRISISKDRTAGILEKIAERTGINPFEVKIADRKVLSLMNSSKALGVRDIDLWDPCCGGVLGIPYLESNIVRRINRKVKAKTFDEIVAVLAIAAEPSTWIEYAEHEIDQGMNVLDICSYREWVYDKLVACGMEELTAFKIMEFMRKGGGAFHFDGGKHWAEYKIKMRECNAPDTIIRAGSKVKYLMPKALAAVEEVESLRLAWFKLYYPEEFYRAWAEEYREEISSCGEDIISAAANTETVEQWFFRNSEAGEKISETGLADMLYPKRFAIMKVVQEMLLRGMDAVNILYDEVIE